MNSWSEIAEQRRADLQYLVDMVGDNEAGTLVLITARANTTLALATAEQMAERGEDGRNPFDCPECERRMTYRYDASGRGRPDLMHCKHCSLATKVPTPLPEGAKEPNPRPNDLTRPSPPDEPCEGGSWVCQSCDSQQSAIAQVCGKCGTRKEAESED